MTTILTRDAKSCVLKCTCRGFWESCYLHLEDIKESKSWNENKQRSLEYRCHTNCALPRHRRPQCSRSSQQKQKQEQSVQRFPILQHVNSCYTAGRETSCLPTVMRSRRACSVCCGCKMPTSCLWNRLFVRIWFVTPSGTHSSSPIPHLSLVRVCTRIPQRIGASKVFEKSEDHTAWYSGCWRGRWGQREGEIGRNSTAPFTMFPNES